MNGEQQVAQSPDPTPHVRRIRRHRRKRSLKSKIKRILKDSGADKKLYIVAAGIIGLVVAVYLYDLLSQSFPIKMK